VPRIRNYSEQETHNLLETFVFPQECDSPFFPADAPRKFVESFIEKRIDAKCTHLNLERGTRLIRFFALRGRIGQIVALLTGGEKLPTDVKRSCHIIVAAGELGQPTEQKPAVDDFQRLVGGPLAPNTFDLLIPTFFSLPAKTPDAPLTKRVHDAADECEKKGPASQLGELMDYDVRQVPWVVAAKAKKDAILAMKPGPERLGRWAEAYLGFEHDTPFMWHEPAGFGLLADFWDMGVPDAQSSHTGGDLILMTKPTPADQAAIKALTDAMAKLDKTPGLDKEYVKMVKTRGYRARGFFLEEFTDEQKEDREKNLRPQDDLIM
jgi:hypothetical protein